MTIDINIKGSCSLHSSISNNHNTASRGRKCNPSRRPSRRNSRHLTCYRIPSTLLYRLVRVLVSLRPRFLPTPKRNIFSKPYQRHLFSKLSKKSNRTCLLLHHYRRSSKRYAQPTLVLRMKDLNWKISMPRCHQTRVYYIAAYRTATMSLQRQRVKSSHLSTRSWLHPHLLRSSSGR